jgi:hypothetical protein
LWGPVGLLLSTPLTLCLVVAGRHVRALAPITILFSDAPGVDVAQRFYHRILLGESDAIIRDAHAYLRKFSFANYCDHVLLPGLALGVDEYDAGQIDRAQQNNIRSTIAALADALIPASDAPSKRPRRRRIAMLDPNVGAHLRHARQMRLGRWQGSLDVPERSVVLCVGLSTERDELLNELFVLAMRDVGIDARSASSTGPREKPDTAGDLVAMVFVAYPLEELLDQWQELVSELRVNLPNTMIVTIRLLSEGNDAKQSIVETSVDLVLRSFEDGVEFVATGRP